MKTAPFSVHSHPSCVCPAFLTLLQTCSKVVVKLRKLPRVPASVRKPKGGHPSDGKPIPGETGVYTNKRIAEFAGLTIAQIYPKESMRNRSIVGALDERAYSMFEVTIKLSHM